MAMIEPIVVNFIMLIANINTGAKQFSIIFDSVYFQWSALVLIQLLHEYRFPLYWWYISSVIIGLHYLEHSKPATLPIFYIDLGLQIMPSNVAAETGYASNNM